MDARQPEGSADSNAARALASPARHCFVNGQPSLLVEWRRAATGWEGGVITVRWLDRQGWATVEAWLDASEILPGGADPAMPERGRAFTPSTTS
ncbi:hypothetical protein NOCA2150024 [metagenome]|uniref:Uncharacterized protein n=1 Tax=metagenome TaxID=256318 RepID=A0A2P2C0P8_9ZZZZ